MDSRAYAMGTVVAIVIVGLVIAGIGMAAYVLYYYVLRGLFARTVTEPAKVVRKIQRESCGGGCSDPEDHWANGRDAGFSLSYSFFIVFEIGSVQQDFAVPERVYADLEEGDTGLLVHRGTIFRKFIKSAPVWSPGAKTQIRHV